MSKRGKGQSSRLEQQHRLAGGPLGIFGEEAKRHDAGIQDAVNLIFEFLNKEFPKLNFQHKRDIAKEEINDKLKSIDNNLGKVLFVKKARIKPDGGVIEVEDRHGTYRVLLVGESKHQGNDTEKIKAGIKQGKYKDADLMVAGNAIERVHKNILEMRNYMLDELHFPYVVFLQGSNFATETFRVRSPEGRYVTISHDAGNMNRIDRVTASSFGMEINMNYCKNQFVTLDGNTQMLQAASLYFKASPWSLEEMVGVMWEVVKTSIEVIKNDLEM